MDSPVDSARGPVTFPARTVEASSSRPPSSPTAGGLAIPDNMRKLTKQDVKILKKERLGKGGFAEVFVGETGGNRRAVKIMDKGQVSKSCFVNLQQEIDICASLSHPCLINTHAIFEDDASIYIVMDLAEGGELFKYMKKFGLEDMPIVAPNFIGEVVLGLEYMASKGVIHRDIKPENLLLTNEYHVKIADFGTVCRVEDETAKFTGTALYVSPEAIAGKLSKTTDIWALGCVLYQVFVGRPPFEGSTEYQIIQNIKARKFDFPPYFPADAKDLVNRMLEVDPEKRIGFNSFAEIKSHPFFRAVQWNTMLTKANVTHLNADFNKEWGEFLLQGESVVYSSPIVKERYRAKSILSSLPSAVFSAKTRILILTDYPRLFYLDPTNRQFKGQVPWSDTVCAQSDSPADFHVYTPERTYHFIDSEKRGALWAAKINDVVKSCKGKVK